MKVLEFIEEALDEIALAIEREVTGRRRLTVGFGRDHWDDFSLGKNVAERIGIVCQAGLSLMGGVFQRIFTLLARDHDNEHMMIDAAETISVMLAVFGRIDPILRKSITFDNDTAFAQHGLLRSMRAMATWFCDAYACWQKGGVENANGRLRRCLPRDIDLDALTDQDIQEIAVTANLTPRKCLGYKTPPGHLRRAWQRHSNTLRLNPLHFTSESTSFSYVAFSARQKRRLLKLNGCFLLLLLGMTGLLPSCLSPMRSSALS